MTMPPLPKMRRIDLFKKFEQSFNKFLAEYESHGFGKPQVGFLRLIISCQLNIVDARYSYHGSQGFDEDLFNNNNSNENNDLSVFSYGLFSFDIPWDNLTLKVNIPAVLNASFLAEDSKNPQLKYTSARHGSSNECAFCEDQNLNNISIYTQTMNPEPEAVHSLKIKWDASPLVSSHELQCSVMIRNCFFGAVSGTSKALIASFGQYWKVIVT